MDNFAKPFVDCIVVASSPNLLGAGSYFACSNFASNFEQNLVCACAMAFVAGLAGDGTNHVVQQHTVFDSVEVPVAADAVTVQFAVAPAVAADAETVDFAVVFAVATFCEVAHFVVLAFAATPFGDVQVVAAFVAATCFEHVEVVAACVAVGAVEAVNLSADLCGDEILENVVGWIDPADLCVSELSDPSHFDFVGEDECSYWHMEQYLLVAYLMNPSTGQCKFQFEPDF